MRRTQPLATNAAKRQPQRRFAPAHRARYAVSGPSCTRGMEWRTKSRSGAQRTLLVCFLTRRSPRPLDLQTGRVSLADIATRPRRSLPSHSPTLVVVLAHHSGSTRCCRPTLGSLSQAEDTDDGAELDLPPQARNLGVGTGRSRGPLTPQSDRASYPTSGRRPEHEAQNMGGRIANAAGAVSQLISGISEDPAGAFRQIDEDFIKPHLLLDHGHSFSSHSGGSHHV